MLQQISRIETFLTSGWVRFLGIPIILGFLAIVYFALGG